MSEPLNTLPGTARHFSIQNTQFDSLDLSGGIENVHQKIEKPENRELVSAALRLLARRDMSRNEFITKLTQISRGNVRTNALADAAANSVDSSGENADAANASLRKNFKSKFKKSFKKNSYATSSGSNNSNNSNNTGNSSINWRTKSHNNTEHDFSSHKLDSLDNSASGKAAADNAFNIADPFAIPPGAPLSAIPRAIVSAGNSSLALAPASTLYSAPALTPVTTLRKRGPPKPAEFSTDEIEAVANWCASEGFLNEARFAEIKARSLSHRYGAKRVGVTLKQKGVAEDLIAETVSALKETDLARARAMWLRKFGLPATSQNERNKHVRYLQSRGFGFDVIKRVINGATDDDED